MQGSGDAVCSVAPPNPDKPKYDILVPTEEDPEDDLSNNDDEMADRSNDVDSKKWDGTWDGTLDGLSLSDGALLSDDAMDGKWDGRSVGTWDGTWDIGTYRIFNVHIFAHMCTVDVLLKNLFGEAKNMVFN